MALKIKKASKEEKKLRCIITGQPGAGKTYGALMLAKGLTYKVDKPKILVFDTECKRSSLKVGAPGLEDFDWDVIDADPKELGRKVTYLDYIEAIKLAEEEEYNVLIIDSATPEWEDILERHSKLSGNSYTNWGKVKALHNEFVNKFLYSDLHIILTVRSKVGHEYDQVTRQVTKVGLEAQQESNITYFADFLFNIQNREHECTAEKDETHIYDQLASFKLSTTVGENIVDWLNNEYDPEKDRKKKFVYHIIRLQDELMAKDQTVAGYTEEDLFNKSIDELTLIGKDLKSKLD